MLKKTIIGVLAILLLVLSVSQVFAQSELTLESLAEQLGLVSDRVSVIESRLTHDAIITPKGNCQLALPGRLHATSLLAYMEKYPDESVPKASIGAVFHLVEDEPHGSTVVLLKVEHVYDVNYRFIYEYWDGCTYLSSSEWKAVDYSGNIVDDE